MAMCLDRVAFHFIRLCSRNSTFQTKVVVVWGAEELPAASDVIKRYLTEGGLKVIISWEAASLLEKPAEPSGTG